MNSFGREMELGRTELSGLWGRAADAEETAEDRVVLATLGCVGVVLQVLDMCYADVHRSTIEPPGGLCWMPSNAPLHLPAQPPNTDPGVRILLF